MKKGFTLIELLVVIAIVAILAVVVVLTINPAELLRQARDATRVSDMGTLNKAISLYYQDAMANPNTMFMGTSSVIYVSVPDPTATAPAGNNCSGIDLPAPPTGYTYHCAASSTYMKVDGTGWIPINFNSYSAGAVISRLPVDPVNTTSTNLYYTYETDGVGGFKVTAFFESQKYAPQMANDGGNDPVLYEKGSNLSLASGRGLVGYWPMDEGTGTVAYDASGNGNTGSWNGTQAGISGYYSPGKVGPWAGYFDGTNNYVSSSNQTFSDFTVCAWVNTANKGSGAQHYQLMEIISSEVPGLANDWGFGINNSGDLAFGDGGGSDITFSSSNAVNTGIWMYACATRAISTGRISLFVNGAQTGSGIGNVGNLLTGNTRILLGYEDDTPLTPFQGLIDDARIYNRALSPAEIQEMYNAEK